MGATYDHNKVVLWVAIAESADCVNIIIVRIQFGCCLMVIAFAIFSTPHSRGTGAIAAALTVLHEKYCNFRILYLRIHYSKHLLTCFSKRTELG